jgi:hypothetical protein
MYRNDCHTVDFNNIGLRFGGNTAGNKLYQWRFQQSATVFKGAGGDNSCGLHRSAHQLL